MMLPLLSMVYLVIFNDFISKGRVILVILLNNDETFMDGRDHSIPYSIIIPAPH